ncbi:coenzyme F420 hydrogenase/dehydrogenase beta subunit N-terminal domain-containing protein, partial [Acinetobacter baumannii]
MITALAGWLLDKGISTTGTSVRQAESSSRSVPVRITTRAEMEATSGSRYAPVNAAALFTYGEDAFQIGKPCEIAAARGTEAAG